MKYFEDELYEYLYDLCETKNIEFHFACFGDTNKFWSSETNSYFTPNCVDYYAKNREDAKELISYVLDTLLEHATKPNHRIALYIESIEEKDDWINMSVGSCLFEDDALL